MGMEQPIGEMVIKRGKPDHRYSMRNGRYIYSTGRTGDEPAGPSTLFLDHEELYLKVETWTIMTEVGLRPLGPDQTNHRHPLRPGRGVVKDGHLVPGSFSGCHNPGNAQCGRDLLI